MVLRFEDVRHLEIPGWSGSIQITGFDIIDIRDRGWENLKWEVKDYENAKIQFYAASAEIVSVAPTAYAELGSSDAEDADDLK
jgi:hypothetical protein